MKIENFSKYYNIFIKETPIFLLRFISIIFVVWLAIILITSSILIINKTNHTLKHSNKHSTKINRSFKIINKSNLIVRLIDKTSIKEIIVNDGRSNLVLQNEHNFSLSNINEEDLFTIKIQTIQERKNNNIITKYYLLDIINP